MSAQRAQAQAALTIALPVDGLTVIAPLPETLTQRNVEAVTGLSPADYLRAVKDPAFPLPVRRVGRLRVVDRVAFVAWLRSEERRAPQPIAPAAAPTPVPANDAPDLVGEVLADEGLQRAPTSPKPARKPR